MPQILLSFILAPALLLEGNHGFPLQFVQRSTNSARFTQHGSSLASSDIEEPPPETPDFDSLGLSREILSAVRAQPGWTVPTPVQSLAIPKILANPTAIWCEAPTGSGKTAAYALPLLQKLYRRDTKGIASMVLCPTRELAVQIGNVFNQLTQNVGGKKPWKTVVLHGGVPLEPQIVALSNAVRTGCTVDVVVATPGRLVDVLTYYDNDSQLLASESALERRVLDAMDKQGRTDSSLSLTQIEDLELDRIDDEGRLSMRELLNHVEYLVIDEADRLLSRAFESEMEACLDLLMTSDRDILPTWLFSATFPKSCEPRVDYVLRRLVGETTPVRILCTNSDRIADEHVSASLQKRLDRTSNTTTLQQIGPASTISHRAIRLELPKRTQALRKLLQDNSDWDRVLVFCATRYASEHVSRKLRRAGIESAELHGKLDQEARLRRLNAFAKGRTRVLVTTDIASRGIDIVGLPAVVNYDLPRSTADFVHRCGRTGRSGRPGTAITFVTPTMESQLELVERRHLSEPIQREVLPGLEPDEDEWEIQLAASRAGAPGTAHSSRGLAFDRMHGGVKGKRKSKKDRLREQAAREAKET